MAQRSMLALAVAAGLTLGTAACASAQDPGSVTGGPGRPGGSTGSSGPGRSTGTSFSLAFARCMRAHGVPEFPDPGGQFPGPADPASTAFQTALNGPCRPLAPGAWVSAGQVTGGA